MSEIHSFTLAKPQLNNSGLTLTECVMAILILSIVMIPALYAVNLTYSAGLMTENAYKAGMLLEGVIAQTRSVTKNQLSLFSDEEINDIWELLTDCDSSGLYDFVLIIENPATGKAYTFTDNPGIDFRQDDFNVSFYFSPSSGSADDLYNLIIDDYTPLITVDEAATENFYIAIRVSSESEIEIASSGEARIFVDIYEDCPVIYSGSGLFVKRHVSYFEPNDDLLICGAVYSKDGTLLNAMVYKGDAR